MQQNDDLLVINNLTKIFAENTILKDVNLTLKKGQIYGLLGQNGTGKTTFMKSILGLVHLTSGSINFCGQQIANGQHPQMRAQIGSLIENPIFPNNYTGQQVLQEQQIMMNIRVKQQYLNQVVNLLDLTQILAVKTKSLSLGYKQRLGIARAVFNHPKLLLLDEPFNGLDPIAVQKVEKLFQYLIKQGMCIIVSSHILEEVANLANSLLIVDQKQILVKTTRSIVSLKDYYFSKFAKSGDYQ
ncbi:ABC transporter ATP-binding protein [Bombilactobacillus bombi]|uniref:ABC transporter ATP-binding protein n=1 Tax=Bombilactobacillus bombi TaxID=1303590 RepID=UPI0015E5B949|nr:ABC transporter ATP-binding protein [Bombilactobacillus bombi]MBA1435259.1 ABC transporter ATP-binding protein [Bombilactobacillus bombi]